MPSTVQNEIRAILNTLRPMKAIGFNKRRVGGAHDGGYVMLDNFPAELRCLSLGIGGDVSWDIEMAQHGAIVHQYDHTVLCSPAEHDRFVFHKIQIGTADDPEKTTMSLATAALAVQATDELAILKMDIEDSEWDVIETCPIATLRSFDQMIIEFHGLHRLNQAVYRQKFKSVFAKLRVTHFPIHIHANNWGGFHPIEGIPVADVIEVTFASRERYQFSASDDVYPSHLDSPCKETAPDLFIGSFHF